MRAFDLLAKAEQDIRNASQPRYHFEMVLLRWMHLRKLVPLTELMEQLGGAAQSSPSAQLPRLRTAAPRSVAPHRRSLTRRRSRSAQRGRTARLAPSHRDRAVELRALKDAFLAEIRAGKGFFYNTVVAQAQRIDVTDDAITFTFSPTHRALREQFTEARAWLESAAERRRAGGSR